MPAIASVAKEYQDLADEVGIPHPRTPDSARALKAYIEHGTATGSATTRDERIKDMRSAWNRFGKKILYDQNGNRLGRCVGLGIKAESARGGFMRSWNGPSPFTVLYMSQNMRKFKAVEQVTPEDERAATTGGSS